VDSSGEARVRLDHGPVGIYVRAKGESEWRPLVFRGNEAPAFYGYSEPTDAIYLRRGGQLELRRLADGSSQTIHEGKEELSLVWDRHRNAAVALETGDERPQLKWFDAELGAIHGILSRALKGRDVALTGWSEDRARFVARASAPGAPPSWYLYDRTRKEISPLGDEYPELKGVAMGSTRWITYKARDGLEIPAYVTLPPGAPAKNGKLPLVVMPHGGPHTRDIYDFDYLAQFLATRGYAVLQPQFRGSSGFGDDFAKAGKGEWGGKMQTDLQDGVAALAAAGDVDPQRVCIVGASFGGYAALAGATLYPDAYRCAASIAGISDLGQLILEEGRLYGRDSGAAQALREDLVSTDREKVLAISPARHVTAARVPILLIHGDKDTVVLIGQSKRMAEALRAAGKDFEFIVLENENHYLTRTATRTQTLEALEKFLAKNLPVN
jgi:dipeptidyl aminopeptidase/acylaminoacyl peptidase